MKMLTVLVLAEVRENGSSSVRVLHVAGDRLDHREEGSEVEFVVGGRSGERVDVSLRDGHDVHVPDRVACGDRPALSRRCGPGAADRRSGSQRRSRSLILRTRGRCSFDCPLVGVQVQHDVRAHYAGPVAAPERGEALSVAEAVGPADVGQEVMGAAPVRSRRQRPRTCPAQSASVPLLVIRLGGDAAGHGRHRVKKAPGVLLFYPNPSLPVSDLAARGGFFHA